MKFYMTAIACLVCSLVIAQYGNSKPTVLPEIKNYCKDGIKCHEAIVQSLAGYTLKSIDSTSLKSEKIVFYEYANADGEPLKFFYYWAMKGADADLKQTGYKEFYLKSILGQYLTMKKIYSEYYGRDVDFKKYGSDIFRFTLEGKSKSISIVNSDSPGYWMIRL